MNINIHLIVLLTISSNFASYAQNAYSGVQSVQLTDGYYQTIDLNPETACRCEKKTERTFSLNKGLVQYDVLNYKLHAYKFSFGNSNVPVSKLFKAMDDDLTIYKISMKEWDSFMLLTTEKFDQASFEKAGKAVFGTFEPISTEEFLLRKNTTSYNEYMKFKQETQNTQK